jgi:hypothetical protein
MTHINNSSQKEESDSKNAVGINSLDVAKSIGAINSFIQAIYNNSQNNPEFLGELLQNPVNLLQILNRYPGLEKTCQDLQQKLIEAATTLGTKDTGATAVSGKEHYELSCLYQILKSDFESVSMQVFDVLYKLNPSFTPYNRNKKIAEIESHLSEIILINNFFPKPNIFKKAEFNTTSQKIKDLIVSSSEIADLKQRSSGQNLSPEIDRKLNELVMNRLEQVLINGLNSLTKTSKPELNYSEIINKVEVWVKQALMLDIKLYPDLTTSLTQLSKKGIIFVMKLTNATPAGRLWIEEKDTQFDQDKHELHPICSESQIEFTIFPGYSIDSVILHKAVVFTK